VSDGGELCVSGTALPTTCVRLVEREGLYAGIDADGREWAVLR
jgi:hypothetical protein